MDKANPIPYHPDTGFPQRETVAAYDELLKGRRQNLQTRYIDIAEPWSYSHFTDTALSQATARICGESQQPYSTLVRPRSRAIERRELGGSVDAVPHLSISR